MAATAGPLPHFLQSRATSDSGLILARELARYEESQESSAAEAVECKRALK